MSRGTSHYSTKRNIAQRLTEKELGEINALNFDDFHKRFKQYMRKTEKELKEQLENKA